MGAREIVELGQSFAEMTRLLRSEEQALSQKVQELERMTRELKTAQKTLIRSEKLASVGKLSAGLAHEIGNPIAAIIGFQELLLSGGLDPDEQRDFLERMKRETERIHNILRQLLDFARPASIHPGPITEQVGAVSEAIQDACGLIRPQRSSRDLAIVEDVESNLPLIHMSREKVTQVLVNLLLNATDAIGGKGHVWLRARQHEGLIRIEVEDDGPGIPDEVGESIFEPFVTTKEVGDGTGLGLAVCRGLIDAAEGSIAFEKGQKGGAKAVILLPVVKQDLT
jgi:C4-dicarboxylate-specific signal transduction histidine kinase